MEVLKKIYLVRHGESVENPVEIFQSPEAKLSERGREQVRIVSKRLVTTRAQVLISSILPRARETTEIINGTLGIPVEETPLLVERVNPPFVNGKSRTDPAAQRVWGEYRNSFFCDPAMHGGESFTKLLARVYALLELFSLRTEKRILAVGHGTFFRTLFALVIHGASSAEVFRAYLASTRLENCAVVPLTMVDDAGLVRWHIDPGSADGFTDRRTASKTEV